MLLKRAIWPFLLSSVLVASVQFMRSFTPLPRQTKPKNRVTHYAAAFYSAIAANVSVDCQEGVGVPMRRERGKAVKARGGRRGDAANNRNSFCIWALAANEQAISAEVGVGRPTLSIWGPLCVTQ